MAPTTMPAMPPCEMVAAGLEVELTMELEGVELVSVLVMVGVADVVEDWASAVSRGADWPGSSWYWAFTARSSWVARAVLAFVGCRGRLLLA